MTPATQHAPSRWLIATFRTCRVATIRRLKISATVCLLFLIHAVAADAAGPEEARLLGPPQGDGPVEVSASFNLSDLTRVEGEHELCVFEGVLTLTWQDPRQSFDADATGLDERIYQGEFQFSEVYEGWWPQLILTNESGEFGRSGNLLRIAPDGTLTYLEELDVSAS
jgi:hypothetical protein